MQLRFILSFLCLFSINSYSQSNLDRLNSELELGGGAFYGTLDDGLFSSGITGFQTQIDYDFIEGPYRAALGVSTQSILGYKLTTFY